MHNFVQNVVALVFAMAVAAGLLFGTAEYIDHQMGNGAGILVIALLIGVVITITIWSLAGFINNRTHASAGDDITSFAEAMSRTQRENARAQVELLRAEKYRTQADSRMQLINHKAVHKQAEQIAKGLIDIERRKWEAERRQEPEDAFWRVQDETEFRVDEY